MRLSGNLIPEQLRTGMYISGLGDMSYLFWGNLPASFDEAVRRARELEAGRNITAWQGQMYQLSNPTFNNGNIQNQRMGSYNTPTNYGIPQQVEQQPDYMDIDFLRRKIFALERKSTNKRPTCYYCGKEGHTQD